MFLSPLTHRLKVASSPRPCSDLFPFIFRLPDSTWLQMNPTFKRVERPDLQQVVQRRPTAFNTTGLKTSGVYREGLFDQQAMSFEDAKEALLGRLTLQLQPGSESAPGTLTLTQLFPTGTWNNFSLFAFGKFYYYLEKLWQFTFIFTGLYFIYRVCSAALQCCFIGRILGNLREKFACTLCPTWFVFRKLHSQEQKPGLPDCGQSGPLAPPIDDIPQRTL